ncbi:dTMP kinase [bacterium]|nr:dTMP kinase [bacterium]
MHRNFFPGRFIVLEGLDKAGKTTQARNLAEYLEKLGYQVVQTAEPTKGKVGSLIRKVLSGEILMDSRTLQLLFTADRSEHLEKVIRPALDKGKVVISDRYFYSTLAYGSIDLDVSWLFKVNRFALSPDLTIFIDVPPDVCLKRLKKEQSKQELFEKKEQLQKVRKTYLNLVQNFPEMIVVDGMGNQKEVFTQIEYWVKRKLG